MTCSRRKGGSSAAITNLFKMAQSQPLLHIFSVFSNVNTSSKKQINVKCDPSSMRHWDSNSRPFGHLSPPTITRAGQEIY